MTVRTVSNLPAAMHVEMARCLFAIELSKQSWVIGFITPLSAKISRPAGYKLVRRAPHARKGLALDQNEAQTNEERQSTNICNLFDDVTDLGAPSSPAPSAHRFAAAGLDRAPKSVTRSYQDR